MHTVRVGGHGYYVDDLPYGKEAGNGLVGESPGRWMGSAASALGLSGEVEPDGFADLLNGRDPLSGHPLPVKRDRVTVAAYDLVFCAPKSVSLLHALGPTELSAAVGDGHDAAVQATTDYLARSGLGVRRRSNDHLTTLSTTGMVGGAFVHRTSRALDPHLHTHVVAANVAQGVDGAWSAVDSRRLFAHAPVAGRLYHAELRHELSTRLGVAWNVGPTGLGDVVGVDPGLRGLFSQRSAEIKAYVADHAGRVSVRGAFYATRPEKDRTVSWDALVPHWRHRAHDLGYDIGSLSQVVGRGRPGPALDVERLATAMTDRARPDATLSRRDIMTAVASAHVGGGRVNDVEGAADRLCAELQASGSGPSVASRTSGSQRWPVPAVSDAVRACAGELTRRSERKELGHRGRVGPEAALPVRSRPPRVLPGRGNRQHDGLER
ncbi:MAG TPA: MobF family relaxase [Acidimicrobiales bacterium]|nr:MobF family relaxase [Acidimicrobiales bacterium]